MWHTIESWNVSLDSFEEKRHVLFFDRNDTDLDKTRIFLTTNHTLPVAVLLDAHPIPLVARYRVLLASIILFLLYALIISELVHQTIAAMFCAFLSLSCLSLVHDRPSLDLVITWIDFGTIGLLFGMMIMVGIFSRTGFFEWAAVKAYKLSRGNLWTLMVLLSTFTCLISSVLDNVTTIILIVPVTIKLCRVLDVDPKLLILSEIIFSNIGGTSTIIGDPPNIIIAGNVYVAPYVNFLTFSAHVTVGVLLCLPVTWFYLWFFYSSSLHRDPVLRVKAEIQTWYKTLSRLDELDPSQVEVRAHVLTYLTKLEEKASELQMKTTEPATIGEMEANYTIKDWPLFLSSSVVLMGVVLLFFFYPLFGLEGLSLAWIAIIGAVIHALVVTIITGKSNVREILEKVEWDTLVFFSFLFILMGAITRLGFIDFIGGLLMEIIKATPEGKIRLFVAIILILWISAFTSAFIDNIPYTVTLVPVIVDLANNTGLPLTPLIWALVFGTCFGGNGTLTGASANVVGVGLAQQHDCKITFLEFMKFGFPILLLTSTIATLWLCIFHVLIPWY
eukprot:TRINITY_DN3554_c0_g1_i25.p1 TRINITY_DN3554_c0_g1~~TRINITY_DN3554_c0_g1_i25.p1  ORF type:complete len:560 (-),score=80.92 TRINITY_DN3554_c0_g1_i25:428-2107(-)